jgi:integrase
MKQHVSRIRLTAGRVAEFTCPAGKPQSFLWDTDTPTLALRVTPTGRKTYVFESRLRGSTIRISIGTEADWPIGKARTEAQQLKMLVDSGTDPREVAREQEAARAADKAAQIAKGNRESVKALAAWLEYTDEGRSVGFTNRGKWGARHVADHEAMADAGGRPFKRGTGITAPGPLYSLLAKPLVKVDSQAVESWLRAQNALRPARAALAFRLLRGFLNWCGEHPVYGPIAQAGAHAPKSVRRLVHKQAPKVDTLQREQLAVWFQAVRADTNVTTAAYLQALLLTGARKGEIAGLRWVDVSFKFGGSMTIRDKVEGQRVIPCPPYLAQVLSNLPRKGQWVFGPTAPRIANNATYNHRRALAAAGLSHVSLHGLRRAFGTLAEWVECPAGVVAQLQGHKPSGTAEKHYRARPLDLLRVWHSKIEGWILEQAGIPVPTLTEAKP